ncbi:MAG: 30S ribosome-binding factor RbfA [Bacteriovoracaceae bacterium]|nr:30S ribosome-binding factor RbfA [Bacteriovoracaceae bacterium]
MIKRNPHAKKRLESQILESLSFSLRKDFADPHFRRLSITHVEVSADSAYAKVYWDTFNTEEKEEIAKTLSKYEGRLRKKLSQALAVRHTPELRFIYNSQYEEEQKITDLLKQNS